MLLNIIFGIIGIIILTAFCLIGAFMAPPVAYWFMTPYAVNILEESGISRKFKRKELILLSIIIAVTGIMFIALIIYAGKQGVESGMNLIGLSIRFLTLFWMTSIFDAIVLDWWMFTKTNVFGAWLKRLTGKEPSVWRVDPQWDGKEVLKLILELIGSVVLAWIFIKTH